MEQWLEWARGPFFRFAILLMILGVLRLLVINLLDVRTALRRAGNKSIPLGEVARDTAKRLFLHRSITGNQVVFSIVSVVFHVCIIVTPLFLAEHIFLWKRGLGIGWPALGHTAADFLTLAAVVSSLILFIRRLASRTPRTLSRFQDFALPLLLFLPFASGYLAMHPALNPFSHDAVMFIHVMSGNLIFILVPFTKLAHMVLFPMTQLVSEMGWHLAPHSGRDVAIALGKENEAI